MDQKLDGGSKHCLCSSLFGEMMQFDEHIFQMGGSTTASSRHSKEGKQIFLPTDFINNIWAMKKGPLVV